MTGRAQKRQHGLDIPVLMKRMTEVFFSSVLEQVNAIGLLVSATVLHGPPAPPAITWPAEAPILHTLAAGMDSA